MSKTITVMCSNNRNPYPINIEIERETATKVVVGMIDPHTGKKAEFRKSDGLLVGKRVSYYIEETELKRLGY